VNVFGCVSKKVLHETEAMAAKNNFDNLPDKIKNLEDDKSVAQLSNVIENFTISKLVATK